MDQIGKGIDNGLIVRRIGVNLLQQRIKFFIVFTVNRHKGVTVQFRVNHPEHTDQCRRADITVGERNCLIGDRERVTHTSCGSFSNDLDRTGISPDVLVPEYFRQSGRNQRRSKILQFKLKTSRHNGNRNILRIGGGQNELDVLRRFLQGFQQGVETGLGQHVHFIDNINLVPS